MVTSSWNQGFIGRAAIITELKDLSAKGSHNRVALFGFGGAGYVWSCWSDHRTRANRHQAKPKLPYSTPIRAGATALSSGSTAAAFLSLARISRGLRSMLT